VWRLHKWLLEKIVIIQSQTVESVSDYIEYMIATWHNKYTSLVLLVMFK